MDAQPSGTGLPFSHVLHQELKQIDERRSPTAVVAAAPTAGGAAPAVAAEPIPSAEEVLTAAREKNLVGLAFSGGGIRSATFNLGVLQGLADLGLLKYFDYLSTVSGGGYIGSWLAAWIKRDGDLGNVEKQLKTNRADQAWAQRSALIAKGDGIDAQPLRKGAACQEEPEPIVHLRAHSNYLAPRLGIFSADVWVLGAIYVRNFLLNQAVLLPAILVVLLLARLAFWLFQPGSLISLNQLLRPDMPDGGKDAEFFTLVIVTGIALCTVFAFGWIIYSLARLRDISSRETARRVQHQLTPGLLHVCILSPLLTAAFLTCALFLLVGADAEKFWPPFETMIQRAWNYVMSWVRSTFLSFPHHQEAIVLLVAVLGALVVLRDFPSFRWRGRRSLKLAACLLPWGWVHLRGCGESARALRRLGVLVPLLAALLALVWILPAGSALWQRSVSCGVIAGVVFFFTVLMCQIVALKRFIWQPRPWDMRDAGLLVVGVAAWLAAAFLIGLATGFVSGLPLMFVIQVGETNVPPEVRLCVAIALVGLVLVIVHFLVYMIHLFLTASTASPADAPSIPAVFQPHKPQRLSEVFYSFAGGRLLGWLTVGLFTGSGAVILLIFLILVQILLLWMVGNHTTLKNALIFGLFIGLFHGSAYLYFVVIVIVGFCRRCWRKSRQKLRRDPTRVSFRWLLWRDFQPAEPICWLFATVLAGMLGGMLLYCLGNLIDTHKNDGPMAIATITAFGPAAALSIVTLAAGLQIGLLGRVLPEATREWVGSLCGWILIYVAAYTIIFGVALFGGWILIEAALWVRFVLGAGWLTAAIGGVLAGRSPKTGSGTGMNWREPVARFAPFIFLTGLLAVLAFLLCCLINDEPSWPDAKDKLATVSSPKEPATKVTKVTRIQADHEPFRTESRTETTHTVEYIEAITEAAIRREQHWQGMISTDAGTLLGWLAGCTILTALMAMRVDVNTFSLNALYGNRLIRCYLGASRSKLRARTSPNSGAPIRGGSNETLRQTNPITGLDALDDFPLRHLTIGATTESAELDNKRRLEEKTPYRGPYLLVNAALNHVHVDNLAWQERMAESFVMSPLFCGSASTGYQPLRPVPGETAGDPSLQRARDWLTLGKAVTISGAAASPNMGYHSSPAVTALMTVFNARLGGWMRNPAPVGMRYSLRELLPRWTWLRRWTQWEWSPDSPRTGLLYLAAEMFGWTGSNRSFVYLSDGGHFENLGVYELVRRRCRFIVVCDAGADPGYEFEDLAGLIRKCRTDFGVRIEIDVSSLKPEGPRRLTRWHCAIGRIRYDDVDSSAVPGILVYVKASLTGDEPSDVQNYASSHGTFPHQTTLDQFFNESQFESYRALGHHVAQMVFSDAARRMQEVPVTKRRKRVSELFGALRRRWFPPPPDHEKNFLESVKAFVEAQHDLRTDTQLRGLSTDLYPEWQQTPPPAPVEAAPADGPMVVGALGSPANGVAELHMVAQMLQVMENAWLGVNLEGYYAHPLNRGWMSVFRRWSGSVIFRKHWPILRGEFSQDFVRFCEDQLGMPAGRVDAIRVDPGVDSPAGTAMVDLAKAMAEERPLSATAARQLQEISPAPARRFVPIEAVRAALRVAEEAVARRSLFASRELRRIIAANPMSAAGPAAFYAGDVDEALRKLRPLASRWSGLELLEQFIQEINSTAAADRITIETIDYRLTSFRQSYGRMWPRRQARLDGFWQRCSRGLPLFGDTSAGAAKDLLVGLRELIQRAWPDPFKKLQRRVKMLTMVDGQMLKVQPVLRDAYADLERLLGESGQPRKAQNELARRLGHWKSCERLPWPALNVVLYLQSLKNQFNALLAPPETPDLPNLFEQTAKTDLGLLNLPPIWLIPIPNDGPPETGWALGKYPCGIIRLLVDPRETGGDYELVVWVRSAFRNQGIGRLCLEKPLEELWTSIQNAELDCLGNVSDFKLLVRYPDGGLPSSGEKLDRSMWLSFFSDYDFRRRQISPDAAEKDLILERRCSVLDDSADA